MSTTVTPFSFGAAWDYAPAPESRSIVRIAKQYGHFIDGKFVEGTHHMPVINPANEEILSHVAVGSDADVDAAVKAARKAFPAWSALPGIERGKFLYRIARLLQEHARELAVLETLDNGKPIKETRDIDVPLAAAHFFYYAGWADKLKYAFAGAEVKPVGVAGQVIPWNFPLLMAAWKLAPALAAGNTVVLKPAETTPLTALRLAELLVEAGLPDGVVNIVNGAGATGAAVVAHPDVDKVAFTGSTGVGRHIQRTLAGTGKRLTLELGGKGANIVFEDAPFEQAIEGVIQGIFFNQGQVCCAGSRLLVQESIRQPFVARLKERMAQLRVGDPLDKNTDVGAINSAAQLARIRALVEAGEAEGGERFSVSCALPDRGFFFAPTVFDNVTMSHTVAQQEIFGPVLTVIPFRTPDEAIELANNTRYGLSAGVWTDKGSRWQAVAGSLRAGVIWGNTFNRFDPTSPFGGYKESGFGREGGLHGLLPYVQVMG